MRSIEKSGGLGDLAGMASTVNDLSGIAQTMSKLVKGPLSRFVRVDGNVPQLNYPSLISLGKLRALGPATSPILPTATTAGAVGGAGIGALHGLFSTRPDRETRFRRFLKSLGKGTVIGAGVGAGTGVLAGGVADSALGHGMDQLNDQIRATGYTLPDELLPYIKKASMHPSTLLAAALCKSAATGLPGLFAKDTGTQFDPNSAMDRYNMSALEGGAPTMDLKQWSSAGRPGTFSPPAPAPQPAAPSLAGWGASAGPQASPMDRQMTAPQPPPAPDPWSQPPPSGGPQGNPMDRVMTAPQPAQDPWSQPPPPGMVGSGVTGQPAWDQAPPPGMVGSGVTGQPEDPWSVPGMAAGPSGQPFPQPDDWSAQPDLFLQPGPSGQPFPQPDDWTAQPANFLQPKGPADDMAPQATEADDWASTGAPQPAPQAPPQMSAPPAPDPQSQFAPPQFPQGVTPVSDPWEELTAAPGGIPQQAIMDAGAPPGSQQGMPPGMPQQPPERINRLTGKPFGYVPQGPDTMQAPPKAQPVSEEMPPTDFGARNTLEQRREYALTSVWPAYQNIQAKARAGQATMDELKWIGQAGRMFDQLEGETTQSLDTDRMRYLRTVDPEAWLDLREATGKMPRFDMQHGGWAMR